MPVLRFRFNDTKHREGELRMFFLLSKKDPEKGDNHWSQVGIVVADSIEQALEKVGLRERERWAKDGDVFATAVDVAGAGAFFLESMEEIVTAVGA